MSLTCFSVRAEAVGTRAEADSVQISLITCGPGREAYSLYGHTAIRCNNLTTGEDFVVNYGVFSFHQPYFILRFVFGLTDYQMGITRFDDFMAEYMAEERWVCEQRLNLLPSQASAILNALAVNYLPENRTYRYNFFYNNCTTKARDVIVANLGGTVVYGHPLLQGVTFRTMLHQWNEAYPWCRLGNDLLLGVEADRQVTLSERQFLPDSLRKDFDAASLVLPSGEHRKLVASTRMLYVPNPSMVNPDVTMTSTSPEMTSTDVTMTSTSLMMVITLLAIIFILVGVIEWRTRRILYGFDAAWLVLTGMAGLILLAMVFSQHPAVQVNFQILTLCPLSLVAVWPIVASLRRHRFSRWLWVVGSLIVLTAILGLWQSYDRAIWFLALFLFIRIVVLYYWCKREKE